MPEIQRQWRSLSGRLYFEVSITGASATSVEDETRGLIAAALHEMNVAGFDPGHIMRSRLWCRDATARREASDIRRAALVENLRASSASFIDAGRMPAGSNVRFDLLAVNSDRNGSRKIIREYDPPIAPPMFASLGDLVFLSGITDEAPHFHTQVAHVRDYVETGLKAAGVALRDTIMFDAYVAKSVDIAAAAERIHEHFADASCALNLHSVSGFSAPAKLLEIEITVQRGGA
ncbi:MAG: hypothetical protein FJX29_00395 [Alphaproteobacteria bacterium]|nr:hypothetical protein [Alphaproteobacteria bacterium]